MAEEYNEEEMYEEQPLSAEELFEQRKAEIEAQFTERSFFKRLSDMFSGLSKPKSSPEYKIARTELQRLAAPIVAILLPTVGVIALIVITAVSGKGKETITVDIASAIEEEAPLEEDQEQDVEEPPPPDETVEIQVDTPVVGPVSDMVSPTPPTNEPVSVKPAPQDSVALIKSPVTMKSMSGSRNPGSIGAMTRGGAGYGDATTEAAVMKALRWLKKTQKPDGSWQPQPVSNTGLAILTFLAHGETPGSKEFGPTVEKAIQYLINMQTGSGNVTFTGADGNEYAVLIATYALGEAFGMTKNPNVKAAAMRSMERIVQNQSATGGWDYKLNKASTRDDLSYAGWALQALKACKLAGLHPDGLDECIKKAIKCLKTRNFNNGAFEYTPKSGQHRGLTATGCLAMQLLGYSGEQEVKQALDYMGKWLPAFEGQGNGGQGAPLPGGCPQYYSYYAAQCKFQAGMCQGATAANVKAWQDWNLAMKQLYPRTQLDGGTIEGVDGKPKPCGYWQNKDQFGAGDTMATCLCALQLMVYYRYLPTTQTKNSASESSGDDKKAKKAKKEEVDVDVDI